MPRNPKRRTEIGSFSDDVMREAVQLVLSGRSLQNVAAEKNLSFQTLGRYVKKQRSAPEETVKMTPNYSVNRIFSTEQEEILAKYLITCSRMFYGLPINDCRKLAYELALKNNLKYPKTWDENKKAGIEWFYGFKNRHPEISLRTPEGCSLARAISFNKHNVDLFFNNLRNVYSRFQCFSDGTRVFNLDETSTSTVQRPQKVIAEKGIKQVNVATSGEKGTHVTTCCIINAAGNALPPVIIFPRVHFKQHMIIGAPVGALGLATPSGWMTSDLFVETMKHFIKHSHSSRDCPSLLIYDNHESHLSIEVLDLAKENGVILTFPPHSTAKLQPLDVGVFGPFTTAFNSAIYSWMNRNPGKNLSIYEVASCVGYAHLKAMTPSNITNAFKNTGIYPFDDQIFTEIDFLSSSVTFKPPSNQSLENQETTSSTQTTSTIDQSPVPSTSITHMENTANQPFIVSPEEVRGYPKATIEDKEKRNKNKKKGKSIIATDTPIREEIREKKRRIKFPHLTRKKQKNIKKKLFKESSDEEEEEPAYIDSSDGLDLNDSEEEPMSFKQLERDPVEGDHVLIQFESKKCQKIYYIGKVIRNKDKNNDLEVSYLRKSLKIHNKFCMPNVPDLASVPLKDIVLILPQPKLIGATKRQQSYYAFDVKFSGIDVR